MSHRFGEKNKSETHNRNIWIGRIAYVTPPMRKRMTSGLVTTRHRFALKVRAAIYNSRNDSWYEREELLRFMEWWRIDKFQEEFPYEQGDLVLVTARVRDRKFRVRVECERCGHKTPYTRPRAWFEVLNIQRLEEQWVRRKRKARQAAIEKREAEVQAKLREAAGVGKPSPSGREMADTEDSQRSDIEDVDTEAPIVEHDPYAGYSVTVRQESAAFANQLHKKRTPSKREKELERLREELG